MLQDSHSWDQCLTSLEANENQQFVYCLSLYQRKCFWFRCILCQLYSDTNPTGRIQFWFWAENAYSFLMCTISGSKSDLAFTSPQVLLPDSKQSGTACWICQGHSGFLERRAQVSESEISTAQWINQIATILAIYLKGLMSHSQTADRHLSTLNLAVDWPPRDGRTNRTIGDQ